MKKAIDWIKTANPNARIYTITPFKAYDNSRAVELDPEVRHNGHQDSYWNPHTNIRNDDGHTFYEYVQAQKEVAQIHGVPCFDLWANQQFSGAQASKYYLSDYTHPNGKGYQAVADALVNFIAYGTGSGSIDFSALASPHINYAIERGKHLALYALFVAAGAEYNSSEDNVTKTAPWGETVTHKAGHYYLNGLGDITETQMAAIYNMGKYWLAERVLGFGCEGARTNLPPKSSTLYQYKTFDFTQAFNNTQIEVVALVDASTLGTTRGEVKVSGLNFFTQSAQKLKRIIGVLDVSGMSVNNSRVNSAGLEYINIKNLKVDMQFNNASLLSKESVLYMIENATPTSAITISLHPNAYVRLADDTDIVTALEAQPLVSLVSA